jgi:transcriptional regulator with XRE-family HTH domain
MLSFSSAFSKVAKNKREALRISKAAVARKAGLHQTYIGLMERGDRSPNLDTAKAIADALETPLSELIREAELELIHTTVPQMQPKDGSGL